MRQLQIDLRSDTKTLPTPGMRRAMVDAVLGDEQAGEDPTVNRLCERVAGLLGKEAAIFLPSGTMCNQIAILVHCRPGDEIMAAECAHILSSESAGSAALAGAQIRPITCERGIFSADQLERALRPRKRNAPIPRLVEVEQTVNRGGGAVWPLAVLNEVAEVARRRGLAVHMDGARLMNAAVASGTPAKTFAGATDSVWVDLSKGLGCPVGGVLAGTAAFIAAAWRWKFRLGGAMRQAGILAAAGLYALDHHIDRLHQDHANAQNLAQRLACLQGVRLDVSRVETNLVFFDVSETGWRAPQLSRALAERGIGIGAEDDTVLRAVTHLGIDLDDISRASQEVAECLRKEAPKEPAPQ